MPNTFNDLIADTYAALDVVSREQLGLITAVSRDPAADRCALGATLQSPLVPVSNAAQDVTPAMALPAAAYQNIGAVPFQITKSRAVPFSWTGEDRLALDPGPGSLTIRQNQVAQAFRTLTAEIETDLATAGALGASRAYGTAGTNPFGTANDMSDLAQAVKMLDDNGAPEADRSFVMNTSATANMRSKQSGLFHVNEAGTPDFLRQGVLGRIYNLDMRQSSKIAPRASGTGAGYLVNNGGGYVVGATVLTLDTGTGTVVAGDVLTIGNYKYVVLVALGGGTVTINAPGLMEAVADNAPVTVNAASSRNLAFSRNAILLGTRLPGLPDEGDLAIEREIIIDPRSGLSFELAAYPGYRMITYHLMIAWGTKVEKPEHLVSILGGP